MPSDATLHPCTSTCVHMPTSNSQLSYPLNSHWITLCCSRPPSNENTGCLLQLLGLSANPWQLGTRGSPQTPSTECRPPHHHQHPECSHSSSSSLSSVRPVPAPLMSVLPDLTLCLRAHPRWGSSKSAGHGRSQPDVSGPCYRAVSARNATWGAFFKEAALHRSPSLDSFG